ncbi:MAG: HAD-IA family hydrolase [Alphaproteobacteria bacterium]|nr:HAD-IA family hydrolase [Alphaproteobacteria bacterium]
MIKALILDVDGTIAETEEVHRNAFNAAFRRYDLPWHWDREMFRSLLAVSGGVERLTYFQGRHVAPGARMDADTLVALNLLKRELYGQAIREGAVDARPGIEDLVAAARDRGVATAIATSSARANVEALLLAIWRKSPEDLFAVMVTGEDVNRKKPSPEVYERTLGRLGHRASDCVAVEDNRNGLTAASRAGIPVVATPSAYFIDDDFKEADLVVDSLARIDPRDILEKRFFRMRDQ